MTPSEIETADFRLIAQPTAPQPAPSVIKRSCKTNNYMNFNTTRTW